MPFKDKRKYRKYIREYMRKYRRKQKKTEDMLFKALSNELHLSYTGCSNEKALDNFRLLSQSGVELMAESILIPGLVEKDEIERIAKFVAEVDSSTPYRVDGFIPIPGTIWRRPTPAEVREAAEVAMRYLESVYCIDSETPFIGEVIAVYPELC